MSKPRCHTTALSITIDGITTTNNMNQIFPSSKTYAYRSWKAFTNTHDIRFVGWFHIEPRLGNLSFICILRTINLSKYIWLIPWEGYFFSHLFSRRWIKKLTYLFFIRHRIWLWLKMRRQPYGSLGLSSSSGNGEPLIVVEETTIAEEEAEKRTDSPLRSLDPDSPSLNPYLLSPWRDTRKHSLPTPQCTSGITASQVCALEL